MSDPSAQQLGDLLRRFRILAGMSQESLAERSGLSVRGISDLERGRRRSPRMATVRMLADALNLDAGSRQELMEASRATQHAETAEVLPRDPGDRQVSARAATLPRQPTRLIGRSGEASAILAMLYDHSTRLVTLTGPGGTGKTRLALHLASELADSFYGGVYVVQLAQLSDPQLVVPTIASALGVNERPGGTFHDSLVSDLKGSSVLLILDNFEHVVRAADDVNALLEALPELVVIVTSRVPLRLRIEHVYSVPALAVAGADVPLAPEDIEQYPALALYAERARMADASFSITTDNVREVRAICAQLDGLPLAIELAAARTRVLSTTELLALLERNTRILTSGARDLPKRHQSLHDTIEWSYALLSDDEQRLFRTLAVFSGGWTLESAESVSSDANHHAGRLGTLDRLTSLLDHSLVRRVSGVGNVSRYVMLNTIQEYAIDQLEVSGEDVRARDRHARYIAARVSSNGGAHISTNEGASLDAIQSDYDNVRSALAWLIEQGAAEIALPMCIGLRQFWMVRGYLSEGRRWMDAALGIDAPQAPEARALCLYGASVLACHQNDLATAARMNEESLAISRASDNAGATCVALHGLGIVAQLRRDYQEARDRYDESIVISRPMGHAMLPLSLVNLAQVCFHVGDLEQSIALLTEGISVFRSVVTDSRLAVSLTDLGLIMLELGRDEQSLESFVESLQVHRAVGTAAPCLAAIEGIAALAVKNGNAVWAATAYGAVEQLRETYGFPRQSPDRWNYEHYLGLVKAGCEEDELAEAWNLGRAMSMSEAVEFALSGRVRVDVS